MYQIGKVFRHLCAAILIMAFSAFAAEISQAAVFCISNTTELQGALTTAQSNGEDDTIRVIQGSYIGSFTYDSSEGHNITLEGGYTEGCLERVVDPSNTILDGNNAGRVLYLKKSSSGDITIEGFTIKNGIGVESGGGMWAKSDSGKITIFNNIITKNSKPGPGAGIWANCGSGSLTIANNTITDNDAEGGGGGVCASGSGGIDVSNNIITYNTAGDSGGGIYFMSGNIIIANNTITGNNATNYGGGVAFPFSSGTLINNTMTKNVAGAAGGGVSALASNLILTNNTITTNRSNTSGGGMHILSLNNKADVYNNIIRDNEGGDIYLEDSGTFSGFNNDYHDLSGTWTNQAGNIDDDPLFVDPASGDYHLTFGSLCIDSGTQDDAPTIDFEGDTRPLDGDGDGIATIDIGSDEYSGPILIPNIVVDPVSVSFGNVNMRSTSTKTVGVNNIGTADLKITSVTITPSLSEFSQTNDCSTITPGGSCTINVTFKPTSAGAKSATLSIASNDLDTPLINVSLSGTGIYNIIVVTVPNGGESWTASSTQTIKWTYTGNPGSYVKIELLKGGVLNRTIASYAQIGSGGNGSFNWAIPSTQVQGSDYTIKVTSTSNSSYTDTSNNPFTILGPPLPSITVTVPNGGESWTASSTQTIKWTYTGNPGSYVKIELLKGGVLNRTIASYAQIGSGGNGYYNWAIPSTQVSGSDYRIRITSTTSSSVTDTSNGDFTILGPTITVTVLDGSETWTAGTTQRVPYYVKGDLRKRGRL